MQFGLLYTGSDDGLIHVSPDGGFSWKTISDTMPDSLWVSRVQASAHVEDRVYASLNGYRWDDFNPYLYVSEDRGETWKTIGNDLPKHPINVIKEDPVDENILYVGTDFAAYVSFDRGQSFHRFSEGLPNVPVHDIVIHPRDHHVLVATHGRSIYKTDASVLREVNSVGDADLVVYSTEEMRSSSLAGRKFGFYENEGAKIPLSIYSKTAGSVQVQVLAENGSLLQTHSEELKAGFNQIKIDGSVHPKQTKLLGNDEELEEASDGNYYLPKGEYTIKVVKGSNNAKQSLMIK